MGPSSDVGLEEGEKTSRGRERGARERERERERKKRKEKKKGGRKRTRHVVDHLHLRDRLQDRVSHLDDVNVRHEVEERRADALEERGRAALAPRPGEEGLCAGICRGRARERRRLALRLLADFGGDEQRGARMPPGGPGREPPRGGGGEGGC